MTAALRDTPPAVLAELGRRGRAVVAQHYDLQVLRQRYLLEYTRIAAAPSSLPQHTVGRQLRAHAGNAMRTVARWLPR